MDTCSQGHHCLNSLLLLWLGKQNSSRPGLSIFLFNSDLLSLPFFFFFLPVYCCTHSHLALETVFCLTVVLLLAFDERDVQQFRKQEILEILKITVRKCDLSYIVLSATPTNIVKGNTALWCPESIPVHFFSIKLLFVFLQLRLYNFLEK